MKWCPFPAPVCISLITVNVSLSNASFGCLQYVLHRFPNGVAGDWCSIISRSGIPLLAAFRSSPTVPWAGYDHHNLLLQEMKQVLRMLNAASSVVCGGWGCEPKILNPPVFYRRICIVPPLLSSATSTIEMRGQLVKARGRKQEVRQSLTICSVWSGMCRKVAQAGGR